MQPLDSNMTKYILKHSLDKDTLNGSNILTNIYTEAINQKLNKFTGSSGDELFGDLVNLMNTDISAYDFATRKTSIQHTINSKDDFAEPINVGGTMVEDSFFVNKETLEQIKAAFI
jgi:hypothetical protein